MQQPAPAEPAAAGAAEGDVSLEQVLALFSNRFTAELHSRHAAAVRRVLRARPQLRVEELGQVRQLVDACVQRVAAAGAAAEHLREPLAELLQRHGAPLASLRTVGDLVMASELAESLRGVRRALDCGDKALALAAARAVSQLVGPDDQRPRRLLLVNLAALRESGLVAALARALQSAVEGDAAAAAAAAAATAMGARKGSLAGGRAASARRPRSAAASRPPSAAAQPPQPPAQLDEARLALAVALSAAIRDASADKEMATALLGGAWPALLPALLQFSAARFALVDATIAALWNAVDACGEAAAEVLANETVVTALFVLWEALMASGHRACDKELRNEVVLVLLRLAAANAHTRVLLARTPLLRSVLLEATRVEREREDRLRRLRLTCEEVDMELKLLQWQLACVAAGEPQCLDQIAGAKLLECVLLYVNHHRSAHRAALPWAPSQLRALQRQALLTLATLAPLLRETSARVGLAEKLAWFVAFCDRRHAPAGSPSPQPQQQTQQQTQTQLASSAPALGGQGRLRSPRLSVSGADALSPMHALRGTFGASRAPVGTGSRSFGSGQRLVANDSLGTPAELEELQTLALSALVATLAHPPLAGAASCAAGWALSDTEALLRAAATPSRPSSARASALTALTLLCERGEPHQTWFRAARGLQSALDILQHYRGLAGARVREEATLVLAALSSLSAALRGCAASQELFLVLDGVDISIDLVCAAPPALRKRALVLLADLAAANAQTAALLAQWAPTKVPRGLGLPHSTSLHATLASFDVTDAVNAANAQQPQPQPQPPAALALLPPLAKPEALSLLQWLWEQNGPQPESEPAPAPASAPAQQRQCESRLSSPRPPSSASSRAASPQPQPPRPRSRALSLVAAPPQRPRSRARAPSGPLNLTERVDARAELAALAAAVPWDERTLSPAQRAQLVAMRLDRVRAEARVWAACAESDGGARLAACRAECEVLEARARALHEEQKQAESKADRELLRSMELRLQAQLGAAADAAGRLDPQRSGKATLSSMRARQEAKERREEMLRSSLNWDATLQRSADPAAPLDALWSAVLASPSAAAH
jgi:hypothetical protein